MKVALAQIEVIPGRPDKNLKTCLDAQHQAFREGADIVVFPELCLSGYLIGDLWEEESFVRDCLDMGMTLARASKDGVTCFGNVGTDPRRVGEDGRPRRFNAAHVSDRGRLVPHPVFHLPFIPKTLLPNYREFEESRYFYDLRKLAQEQDIPVADAVEPVLAIVGSSELKLGVFLCEDGWHEDYYVDVPRLLAKKGANVLINLSGSPFTLGKEDKRRRVFSAQAKSLSTPLVYVNCTGMQNNAKTLFSFDGNSCAYDKEGEVIFQAAPFEESVSVVDLENTVQSPSAAALSESEHIHRCMFNSVSKYLTRFGIEKVVIGVSGGIDSAVSAAFFVDMLGPDNVLLVNMPGKFNTNTTKSLAEKLALNLGARYIVLPIEESAALTVKQIEGLAIGGKESLHLTPFHLENVQARDRSSRILAAVSAAFGGVFPSNANKAETTVGYATMYGDHAGFLAPLADLWKHQVYALGEYLNDVVFQREVIPRGIFDIRPTAELSDAQNPEKGGGDPLTYWYHDKLFDAWMQRWRRAAPEELLRWYKEGTVEKNLGVESSIAGLFPDARSFIEDIERWWRLFKGLGVVKRVQAPPVVAVCRRAFGFDYRESLMEPYFTAEYLRLKDELLA
jgi:NAD+ synthase (glutamine-hydrolysing)